MSSLELDQVLYARAGWRKAILIPLWTFQIAVLLCLMGIFAYRLAETFEHYEELDKLGEVPIVEVVWEATNVGFNLIALILNILEIARKATERLTPFTMICTHVIKLTLAFAVLALDIVAYLQHMDGHYSTIGLSLDCGLLAANLTTFVYALLTYRRLLKYEDYHLTTNAKTGGGGGGGYLPAGDSVELGYNNSKATQGITTTRTTEVRYSDTASYPSQSQLHPSPLSPPRESESDSAAALKQQVDRAISHEFGWGSRSSATGGPEDDQTAVNRSGSVVVGSGRVAVHHGLVAGVQRQHSWVTERGVIAEEDQDQGQDGGDRTGGVMGRVGGGGGGGRRGREEDEEALLSPPLPGNGR